MPKKRNPFDDRLNPMPIPGGQIYKAVAGHALKKKVAGGATARRGGAKTMGKIAPRKNSKYVVPKNSSVTKKKGYR
jgi:hypothetical protein